MGFATTLACNHALCWQLAAPIEEDFSGDMALACTADFCVVDAMHEEPVFDRIRTDTFDGV